jgi:hypothetical protein
MAASVEIGGQLLEGTVENLSLRGMFMATDHKPGLGEDAEITIELVTSAEDDDGAGGTRHNGDTQPTVQASGKVVRVTGTGIAFCFDTVDFDSYMHLKNIVALNAGDPERTFGEMDSYLDGSPAPS